MYVYVCAALVCFDFNTMIYCAGHKCWLLDWVRFSSTDRADACWPGARTRSMINYLYIYIYVHSL